VECLTVQMTQVVRCLVQPLLTALICVRVVGTPTRTSIVSAVKVGASSG